MLERMSSTDPRPLSRRAFLSASAGASLLAACAGGATVGSPGALGPVGSPAGSGTPGASPSPVASPTASAVPDTGVGQAYTFPLGTVSINNRAPNSLPDLSRMAGQADTTNPIEHYVVIMMENHSCDNYFGMLPVQGQPLFDGFTFDANGKPMNKNPLTGGYQHVFHLPDTCQPNGVNQQWTATRDQIDKGAMDGFPPTDLEAMGYFDNTDLPFLYSLANTFCVGNRAYCSATAQTYPNHRYMLSGTSQGYIATSDASLEGPGPANGTLQDMMTKYGVSWKDYFVDLPGCAIIPQNVENHPTNFAPNSEFLADLQAGTLPSVSYVDPEFGATDDVGGALFPYLQSIISTLPAAIQQGVIGLAENTFNSSGGDEENPQDIAIGEIFLYTMINACIASPLWPKMMIMLTWDEHGGYYDHVPPAAAVEPDAIQPMLSSTDYPGMFNITGVRVPFVVISPYSKPHGVSNVPHEHTAIIATIAQKFNLPALTYRDAQSPTLHDYLNLNAPPALLKPPTLATPRAPEGGCNEPSPSPVIAPNTKVRPA
jgi:phospholipase C